jgi:hypothetical protein
MNGSPPTMHLLPLRRPDELRLTISVVPTKVVGQAQVNVTPEGFAGGWEQVMEILMQAMKVAAREWGQTLARSQARVPLVVLPGSGETL